MTGGGGGGGKPDEVFGTNTGGKLFGGGAGKSDGTLTTKCGGTGLPGSKTGALGMNPGGRPPSSSSTPWEGDEGEAKGSSTGWTTEGVRPPVTDGVKRTFFESEDVESGRAKMPTSGPSPGSSPLPSNSSLTHACLNADLPGPLSGKLGALAPGVATVLHSPGLVGPSFGATNPCGGIPGETSGGGVVGGKEAMGPGGGVERCMAGGDAESGRAAGGSGLVAGGVAASAASTCSPTPPGVGLRPSRNALAMSAAFHFA